MNTAPAASPSSPARTLRLPGSAPRGGLAALGAMARTLRRVLPLPLAAQRAAAAASDDKEETVMHSPCL
jgi:hypothetical protein